MSFEWESIPAPERRIERVCFERKLREWCDCYAVRVGHIYKRPGEPRLRWELIEYDPDTGDPQEDRRAIAGGWGEDMPDAQRQCEGAYHTCRENQGPL